MRRVQRRDRTLGVERQVEAKKNAAPLLSSGAAFLS
jgi:hypothetical protein